MKLEFSGYILFIFNMTTNTQLSHKLSYSYIFRYYRVIFRGLVINVLPSYTSSSSAAVGLTVDN